MSDDLVRAARSSYASPHYVDGESVRPLLHVLADRIEAQAAEITRLRAALATAIRAAAKDENRPSEEIIREDRDAWPDRQANDPIRAAAKEGKP